MAGYRHPLLWCQAFITLAVAALLGCTDTVEVPREVFNPPVDANSGFLGYFDVTTKQTTCGNCHSEKHADWGKTKHASAYADLVNSNHSQTTCFTCHTVSENGNLAAAPAGWNAKQDSTYHDVQCESCHGPGFTHVQSPTTQNIPLAHEAVLKNPTVPTDNSFKKESCGACHSGVHDPFEEEWAQSGHARPLQESDGSYVADHGASCASCHEGHGILAAWSVVTNYAERDSAGSAHYFGITCGVCHDPHGTAKGGDGKPLAGQLRFPIDVPDVNVNLCMKCHQRRPEPDSTSSRGPHSPQGPMLLGDAGYKPAGFNPAALAPTTHGITSANPRLCAGCHVNGFTVTDKETGAFTFQSVGHLFRPDPCLDAGGKPVADNSCPHTTTARFWGACTNSGCHASAAQVVTAFLNDSMALDGLTKTIWDDKNGNDKVDAAPTDAGLLSDKTNVPDTNYNTTNAITPAEGAVFNVRMLRSVNGGDRSYGVHNPFLAQGLLRANIVELLDAYPGLPHPPGFSITSLLNDPINGVPLRGPLMKLPPSPRR
jgi:hypothetical protein